MTKWMLKLNVNKITSKLELADLHYKDVTIIGLNE